MMKRETIERALVLTASTTARSLGWILQEHDGTPIKRAPIKDAVYLQFARLVAEGIQEIRVGIDEYYLMAADAERLTFLINVWRGEIKRVLMRGPINNKAPEPSVGTKESEALPAALPSEWGEVCL